MRIGAFVKTLNTTVDTVRHYEELGLIHPVRDNQQKYKDDHFPHWGTGFSAW